LERKTRRLAAELVGLSIDCVRSAKVASSMWHESIKRGPSGDGARPVGDRMKLLEVHEVVDAGEE
jgi:hypothetical protein